MPSTSPERSRPLRVVVIDADDLVCQTVAALLGIGDRIAVIGMAGKPDLALELVLNTRPDVALVDPRLPDLDAGLALIRRIHEVAPSVRVLVVCSPEFLDRAAAGQGVDGYLRKTFRTDDLTAALEATVRTSAV